MRQSGPSEPDGDDELAPLLRRCRERDERAFETFYDRTRRRVFGLALRILGDSGLAEEAALEAYAQAWRRAEDFDPDRGSGLTWILTIARTRALDLARAHGRRASRQEALESAADAAANEASSHEACAGRELRERLLRAMALLPANQRAAIETAYFEGLSYTEAASALGLPEGTVKTRIRLALAALRLALGCA